MTRLATDESSLMGLVFPVAGDAGGRNVFVVFVGVASGTLDPPVFSSKHEVRLRVIKPYFFPVGFGVAILAAVAKQFLVRLVGPVAGNTIRRRFAEQLIGYVTGRALNADMAGPERIVGQAMIEGARLETDDILAAPLVIGVADAARTIRRLDASVESAFHVIVGRHFLVTIEAQARLGALIERSVAGFACRLEFRVFRRESAWRHKLLKDRLRHRGRRGCDHRCNHQKCNPQ